MIVVLQLVDRNIRCPEGFLDYILLQVKGLLFLADFYVLDMSNKSLHDTTLILGRPFLRISCTIINMKEGSITMEIGNQKISFNMYGVMKHPHEDYSLLGVNTIDMANDKVADKHELDLHGFYDGFEFYDDLSLTTYASSASKFVFMCDEEKLCAIYMGINNCLSSICPSIISDNFGKRLLLCFASAANMVEYETIAEEDISYQPQLIPPSHLLQQRVLNRKADEATSSSSSSSSSISSLSSIFFPFLPPLLPPIFKLLLLHKL